MSFPRVVSSGTSEATSRTAGIERYNDTDGVIPPNQAVSVQRRDILEKVFGVFIKSDTENDRILKL